MARSNRVGGKRFGVLVLGVAMLFGCGDDGSGGNGPTAGNPAAGGTAGTPKAGTGGGGGAPANDGTNAGGSSDVLPMAMPCTRLRRLNLPAAASAALTVLEVSATGQVAVGGAELHAPFVVDRDMPASVVLGSGVSWTGQSIPPVTPEGQSSVPRSIFGASQVLDLAPSDSGSWAAVGVAHWQLNDGTYTGSAPLLLEQDASDWRSVPIIFPESLRAVGSEQFVWFERIARGMDGWIIAGSHGRGLVGPDESLSVRYDGSELVALAGTPRVLGDLWSDQNTVFALGDDGTSFGLWQLEQDAWTHVGASSPLPDGLDVRLFARFVRGDRGQAVVLVEGDLGWMALQGGVWTQVSPEESAKTIVGDRSALRGAARLRDRLIVALASGSTQQDGSPSDLVAQWDGTHWSELCRGGLDITDLVVSGELLYVLGGDANGSVLAALP